MAMSSSINRPNLRPVMLSQQLLSCQSSLDRRWSWSWPNKHICEAANPACTLDGDNAVMQLKRATIHCNVWLSCLIWPLCCLRDFLSAVGGSAVEISHHLIICHPQLSQIYVPTHASSAAEVWLRPPQMLLAVASQARFIQPAFNQIPFSWFGSALKRLSLTLHTPVQISHSPVSCEITTNG